MIFVVTGSLLKTIPGFIFTLFILVIDCGPHERLEKTNSMTSAMSII